MLEDSHCEEPKATRQSQNLLNRRLLRSARNDKKVIPAQAGIQSIIISSRLALCPGFRGGPSGLR